MHLDLIESVSLAGDPAIANDDRVGATGRLAWVIDGATDLGPPGLVGARGGAAWLADVATQALASHAWDEGRSLRDVCADVFAIIADRFARERQRAPAGAWEIPRASLLAVLADDGHLDCAWLGDCSAIVAAGDDVRRIGPVALRDRESAAAAAVIDAAFGDKPMRSPAVIADRRATRDRVGGNVLGIDATAMRAALSDDRCALARGDDLLLMTDGFAAIVDGYGDLDDAGLIAAVRATGLADVAIRLRAIERADARGARFPRFKPSDDATAIWLRVG